MMLCVCSCSKPELYVHMRDGAKVDIFYICSTETGDWLNEKGDTMHFADMSRPDHHAALYAEMRGVDSLLSIQPSEVSIQPGQTCVSHQTFTFNFYAPYYNQATLEGLLRDTAQFVPRCAEATKEVQRAFDYYMQHENSGRRFVLIGYSQGGYAVVQLLKQLSEEQASRMVAAYVIGYQLTAEDLRYPYIRPAQSASDTGVTVCFNSVASADAGIAILSGQTAVGINPVNWTTDPTPASYLYDFGGAQDTLTATLDTLTHLTVIRGYRGACPTVPFVGRPGNYHCLEIPLHYRALRENIAERCSY